MNINIFEEEMFKKYTEEEVNSICKYKTYEDFIICKFIEKYSLQVDIDTQEYIKDYVKFDLADYYTRNYRRMGTTIDQIKKNNDIYIINSHKNNHENIKELFRLTLGQELEIGIPEIPYDGLMLSSILCLKRPSSNTRNTGEHHAYMYTYISREYFENTTAIRIMYIPEVTIKVEVIHCKYIDSCWHYGDSIAGNIIALNPKDTRKFERYIFENKTDIIQEYRNKILNELHEIDEERELERAESMIDYFSYMEEFDPEEEGLNDLYDYYNK